MYTGFVDNLLQSNFATILPDTTIKPNTEFGTYEKTSDDPLTVTYTFNDKAVWSDGVPIDCDDAMLAWAALSGSYPTGQNDDAGNPIDIFTPASTNGFAEVNKPTCKAGDKSFTFVYKTPYADWEALFTQLGVHAGAHRGRAGRPELRRQRGGADRRHQHRQRHGADAGRELLEHRLELPAGHADHSRRQAAAEFRAVQDRQRLERHHDPGQERQVVGNSRA